MLTKIDIRLPINSVISRVLGTAPGSDPFRGGFGYIGITNGNDNRIVDMALINQFESKFCTRLIRRHLQIGNRLGLACLVNVLILKFEIHLRQHVLPNLEAAGTGIRNSAIFYRDSLGVLINESNYAQVLELFTIRGRALKKFPEIFEGVLGDLAYYEVDTGNRFKELYKRYAGAVTDFNNQ